MKLSKTVIILIISTSRFERVKKKLVTRYNRKDRRSSEIFRGKPFSATKNCFLSILKETLKIWVFVVLLWSIKMIVLS